MRIVTLPRRLSKQAASALRRRLLDQSHYNLVVTKDEGPVQFVDDEGDSILSYVPDPLSPELCKAVYKSIYRSARDNVAGGKRSTAAGVSMKLRVKCDGTLGKRLEIPLFEDLGQSDQQRLIGARQGVVGSLERTADTPRCRQTEYGPEHPDVRLCLPLFRRLAEVFKEAEPKTYAAQSAVAAVTRTEYLFPGTPHTTATINRNRATACHRDNGDLPAGRGVITVLKGGRYSGGLFVVPEYGLAVDPQTRDVIICDTHGLWHGNTSIVGLEGEYERLAVILYYRTRMQNCLDFEGEIAFAQNHRHGQPLFPSTLPEKAHDE
jgi:Oxygenase domain of the 2OGFeDO superfamily